jgi:hypothetical protein
MESKNLIFKNGHFYDSRTKERIGLADGADICIVALSGCFTSVSPVGTYPLKILNQRQKELEIYNESDLARCKKIYDMGAFLYFSISRSTNKKTVTHEFKVELLEDLYLYLKKTWKQQEEKLYDCACVVRENISRTIDFFEEINAGSLNEAFKYTFVHYFGNDGNPACNALERFFDKPNDENSKISRFRE